MANIIIRIKQEERRRRIQKYPQHNYPFRHRQIRHPILDQNIRTVPDDDTPKTKSTTTPDGIVPPKTKIPKPYASHRDWDAIEKDVENEIANETPVGDAAMNQLFQQIYANADDDTKRAMIKSYQTSGGTVLSTNWNEVAQKDYEHQDRIAPDGQEWKTWEGKKLTK